MDVNEHRRTSSILPLSVTACACLAVLAWPGSAIAQPAAAGSNAAAAEAAAIGRGWSLLASGDIAGASKISAGLVSGSPRSAAAGALAVETEIARAGAAAGLDVYERWLGSRTLDDGYLLRIVARALLRAVAKDDRDAVNRLQAIEALKADGEADLLSLVGAPESAPPRLRAAAGGENVDDFIAMLNQPGPTKRMAIRSLGSSGSRRAVAPLTNVLSDPDPFNRSAAADALASLRATSAIPQLKVLLEDPVFDVHLSAARALLTLNDASGVAWLRQLQSSEHAGIRLVAAQALKSEAGAEWQAVVRELTKDADPEIRRQAAELIAPYEPETSRDTLQGLLNDPNPVERQAAAGSLIKSATDFPVLRRYLRSDDPGTRIQAASRVLELSR